MNTPALAIFAYRRPQALQACLASLAACPGADTLDATVFVDGPADAAEQALTEETARVAEAFQGFRSFEVCRAETHLGLGASIIRGITRVLETHPSVIVLEDDLTVQPGFLRFILDGLDRYSEDRRVFSICGYTNRVRIPEGYPAVRIDPDTNLPYNFGGRTVYIYDWWSSDDAEHSGRVANPDENTQKLYAYRDWLEETYNVIIVETALGDWSSQPEELAGMDWSWKLANV